MEKLEEKKHPFFDNTGISYEQAIQAEYFEKDPVLQTLAETPYFQSLENKTQVTQRFICEKNVATRLSHTMQVMQLSEKIAQIKEADIQTTLRIAAFHDCGHLPFGHTGERVMRDIIKNMNQRDTILGDMIGRDQRSKIKIYNNFTHEVMSARIFENITQHHKLPAHQHIIVLEGILKHGGGMLNSGSIEGRIIGVSDKVSYLVQDLKDAQKVGFELNHPTGLGNTPEEILRTIELDIKNNAKKDIILSKDVLREIIILKQYMHEEFYISEDIELLDRMMGSTLQAVFLNWCSEIFELREDYAEKNVDEKYYRDFFNLRKEQELKAMLNFDESFLQFVSLSDDQILERSDIQTKENLKKRVENYKNLGIIEKYS